jgi:predicted nuclease of predicted toxin-antitoxin system
MKFKIDENLPVETAAILQQAGHDAETVHSEKLTGTNDQNLSAVCQKEDRILITLDIGFADIRTYPPKEHPGFIILRSKRQDKPYIVGVIQNIRVCFISVETVPKVAAKAAKFLGKTFGTFLLSTRLKHTQNIIPAIEKEEIMGKLWIVEEKRIRVRS